MRLSLRLKLWLLAALPLGLYAFAGMYMLGEQRDLFNEMTDEIYETSNKVEVLIANADRDMYQAYIAYLQLESNGLNDAGAEAAKAELTSNYEQAVERAAEAKATLNSKGLLHLAHGESGRSIGQIFDMFEENFAKWLEDALLAIEDGKFEAGNEVLDANFQFSRTGIDEIGFNAEVHAGQTINRITEDLDATQLKVFVSVIVLALLLTIMVTVIIYRMMKTIKTVVAKTRMVSEGDLTALGAERYDHDELGDIERAVDNMIGSVNGLIAGIATNTKQVGRSTEELFGASKESATASEQVALNIQEVANGSEAQARGAVETSRAIEEMAIGIGRIAGNTSAIAEHSASTAAQSNQGGASLERLVRQMEEISGVIGNLSATIATLEIRSQKIGDIADNITAFANQTNILSLNASIEAARAGEQGRGFAVVAGEIRKLAVSSLESAGSIHELVTVTRNDIDGASAFMQQTMQEVDRGSEHVKEVSENLNVIRSSIAEMAAQLQDNSAITEQMSASSEQVSAAMEQTSATAAANLEKAENVAAATEEQLALMDNIASSARQLDEIVRNLHKAVANFKVRG